MTNTLSIQVVTNPFRKCQTVSKVTFTTNIGEGHRKNKGQTEMATCVEVRKQIPECRSQRLFGEFFI
jgi:hypothetical protein